MLALYLDLNKALAPFLVDEKGSWPHLLCNQTFTCWTFYNRLQGAFWGLFGRHLQRWIFQTLRPFHCWIPQHGAPCLGSGTPWMSLLEVSLGKRCCYLEFIHLMWTLENWLSLETALLDFSMKTITMRYVSCTESIGTYVQAYTNTLFSIPNKRKKINHVSTEL